VSDEIQALAEDYLDLQDTIRELESRCKTIKDQLQGALPGIPNTTEWVFGKARISMVKGRKTERTDVKKVRVGLMLEGVDSAIVEKVFSQSTTVSEGTPHLRIASASAAEEGE
jgi:hypothetical protein